jgi:hypothetical protein
MPYVLDESSYRIEKNTFPTAEEAKNRAAEAARILGRPVTVYELIAQHLHFAFRVMPDGSVDQTEPLPVHIPVKPSAPAVLGRRVTARSSKPKGRLLDAVAEALEAAGRMDLAAEIDKEAVAKDSLDEGLRAIVDELKRSDMMPGPLG